MAISAFESILIIAVCAACTFAERALPFVLFRGREVPGVIRYLGRALPLAIMTTLIVYCVRDISFTAADRFIPYLAACTATAGLHLLRHNSFLSILGGTAVYMILVQTVFAA